MAMSDIVACKAFRCSDLSIHPTRMIAELHEKHLARVEVNDKAALYLDEGLMLSNCDGKEIIQHLALKFDLIEKEQ